ncbi:MAG TPA: hypothetical protein P5063_02730 [Methanomassiliicoccales archaeon]|nr:hypothetical protein [Methanomassiliicoccales archaeon]
MPYRTIADLPENIRNSLTEEEAKRFIAAFNVAYKDGKDEETCFKIAMAAAKKREASAAHSAMRMLNRTLSFSNYIEVDGGMLVKDVPLLAVGEWRDSAVGTPLYYPAKVLERDALNWYDNSFWARHGGKVPRSVVSDLIGEVRNIRYDGSYKENGMVEPGAILGDIYYSYSTQAGKDAAAQALARAKAGNPLAVSVEHGGGEKYNPKTKRMEATDLWFGGVASVVRGACERCVMPRANEADADGTTGDESMDEETQKALSALEARLKACEEKLAALTEGPPAEVAEEVAEMGKKLGAALEQLKELEGVKKMNATYEERIKALEKTPNRRTVAEQERELEQLTVPDGYSVRRV